MVLMNNVAPQNLAKFLSRMDPRPTGGLLVGQVGNVLVNLHPIGNRSCARCSASRR
jgi:hypothetical protein